MSLESLMADGMQAMTRQKYLESLSDGRLTERTGVKSTCAVHTAGHVTTRYKCHVHVGVSTQRTPQTVTTFHY